MRSKSTLRPCAHVALTVLAAIASGCGGGGGASPPPPQPVNSAPLATGAALATSEDVPLLGTLRASDPDGQALNFEASRAPAHGTLSVDARTGSFTYSPASNYTGADDFLFTATDGTAVSTPAQVSIQVSPVNDDPTIQKFEAPSGGEAGLTVVVVVQASDAEGAVTMDLAQTGGVAVTNLVARADGFEFRLPDADVAQDAALRLRVVDKDGAAIVRDFTVAVWPVSASGKLTTLFGSISAPGMHWVITGDGFRASERALLQQRARETANSVLAEPSFQRHRGIWNVHVLNVVSAESGADVPSTGEMHDTAFDASFDCFGTARLLCVDWLKVWSQLSPEFPDYDALTVMVNSERYGGSGAAFGAVISLNPLAPRLMLHEMGHSFAGLADEYVSSAEEALRAGTYVEGAYPNISQIADVARIPWRRWFADPNNVPTAEGAAGIGRFEGGYYSPTGFYRPTFDSFMRTLMGDVNAVQAEAWTRAIYDRVAPIQGSSPAGSTLALAPDERRTFAVLRAFAGDVQSARWYLDGNEVVAARDADQMECCTGLTGSHTLRVDVADATGVIRLPGSESSAMRSWDLTIDPNLSPGGAAQPGKMRPSNREAALFIRMRVDGAGHHVEEIRRVSPVNRGTLPPSLAAPGGFHFEITDAAGTVLSAGDVEDPRVLRGPLPLPGESASGHDVVRQAAATYIIRAPDMASMRYLRIGPSSRGISKARATDSPQVIDISSSLIR